MATKPRIQDVAKMAGVSIATVSHVINNSRFVSDPLKEKVYEAISELGYTPNAYARGFRTGKKKMIGFIVPDISNKFFATLVERAEHALSKKGYHLIIANTKEMKDHEKDDFIYFSSGVADGLLLASTHESWTELGSMSTDKFPIVLVDRTLKDCPFDSVTISAYQSVYTSVCNLVKSGKRRIGCISGVPRLSTTKERLGAYIQAMEDCGIEITDEMIQTADVLEKSAFASTEALLAAGCDAMLISNGAMTTDVLLYLKRQNIEIGKDISMVCVSDFPQAELEDIKADIVELPVDDLGRLAGEQILKRIKNPAAVTQNIILHSTYRHFGSG